MCELLGETYVPPALVFSACRARVVNGAKITSQARVAEKQHGGAEADREFHQLEIGDTPSHLKRAGLPADCSHVESRSLLARQWHRFRNDAVEASRETSAVGL